MPLNLSQYVSEVRRITRLQDAVPYTDEDIRRFINHAKDVLSGSVPFCLKTLKLDSEIGRVDYAINPSVVNVLGLLYYPYGGSTLSANTNNTATSIPVVDGSVFPNSGFAILGDLPNVEIVEYTGKSGNTLTPVTRGRYGTPASSWNSGTVIRVWEDGAKWDALKPTSDITIYRQQWWLQTPQSLISSKSTPSSYAVRGNTLMFDRAFYVKGKENIWLYCLTQPADLVLNTDMVEGLPSPYDRIIVLHTAIDMLTGLGGDEAVRRVAIFAQQLNSLMQQFAVYVENRLRGAVGAIEVDINRPPYKPEQVIPFKGA